jgi:transposase
MYRQAGIYTAVDPAPRPCAFHLTPGQDADIAAAPALLQLAPPMAALIADKGYDGDDFRADIVNRGARTVIPNKSNKTRLHRFSKLPTKHTMSSNAASTGSRISAESQPATTSSPATSSPQSNLDESAKAR